MKIHKLVLIGNAFVGKSSLILRLVKNLFIDYIESTIGAAFFIFYLKNENLDDVKLEIWDTSGSEKHNAILPMYYRKASIVFTVFDLNNRKSFDGVKKWIHDVKKAEPTAMIYLLANKCDLPQMIEKEEYENYAKEENLELVICSAKTGQGLQDLFSNIHHRLSQRPELEIKRTNIVLEEKQEEPKRWCC